jgi:hypothetical protein
VALIQGFKVVAFPEKKGVIRGDGIQKMDEFPLVGFQDTEVFFNALDACFTEALGKPGTQELLLPIVQVDAAFMVNQVTEPLELFGCDIHRSPSTVLNYLEIHLCPEAC